MIVLTKNKQYILDNFIHDDFPIKKLSCVMEWCNLKLESYLSKDNKFRIVKESGEFIVYRILTRPALISGHRKQGANSYSWAYSDIKEEFLSKMAYIPIAPIDTLEKALKILNYLNSGGK